MKLPSQKKIMREDLKDAPEWVDALIDPVNNFMETVYQALNKNIDEINLLSQIKEMTVITPSTYPAMPAVKFQRTLKVKATGLMILQCMEKSTMAGVATTNPAWVDNNGTIEISTIEGLAASKVYNIRFRVT